MGVVVVLVAGMAVWGFARSGNGASRLTEGPPALASDNERITVEVLNTTTTRGLARRATVVLRTAGLDVVRYGSDSPPLDSTVVLDRSGHPERARRVARALGTARIESRPDSTRFLDVTVLLGADWRPPAQPFRP